MTAIHPLIRPLDADALTAAYRAADPFPHLVLDNFLVTDFASEVAATYPTYDEARRDGKVFFGVNESRKAQVSDSTLFPKPVAQLAEALSAPAWREFLSQVTGIPELTGDPSWQGGGMHVMATGAHLDVHVDYNLTEEGLHRRLNVLLFLNPGWQPEWGGRLELWDAAVGERRAAIEPVLNRCAIFATSATSYHGVERVTCPPDRRRASFAGYYHTSQAPEGWNGEKHGTLFKARPSERLKGSVFMPLQGAAIGVISKFGKRAK